MRFLPSDSYREFVKALSFVQFVVGRTDVSTPTTPQFIPLTQMCSQPFFYIRSLRCFSRLRRVHYPFHVDAWVVLPEYMHYIWALPPGDDDFSGRWREIKKAFSRALPQTELRLMVRIRRKERAIWQRRFWDHTIRDDRDYTVHMDYLHYNAVKHGWVTQCLTALFELSSVGQKGAYPWGQGGCD